mgnify:CR=1 FL=1
MQEMFSDWMDHKEVIPASYQEYDDKCEEEDGDDMDDTEESPKKEQQIIFIFSINLSIFSQLQR